MATRWLLQWLSTLDKAVGPERLSLGVEFLNRNLEMTVANYKMAHLLELLNTEWNIGLKCFTAIIAAILIGNMYAATITCSWIRWLLHHLIHAIKTLIYSNYHRQVRTCHFNEHFEERDKQWLDRKTKSFAFRLCTNRSILKAVRRCQFTHWITSDML